MVDALVKRCSLALGPGKLFKCVKVCYLLLCGGTEQRHHLVGVIDLEILVAVPVEERPCSLVVACAAGDYDTRYSGNGGVIDLTGFFVACAGDLIEAPQSRDFGGKYHKRVIERICAYKHGDLTGLETVFGAVRYRQRILCKHVAHILKRIQCLVVVESDGHTLVSPVLTACLIQEYGEVLGHSDLHVVELENRNHAHEIVPCFGNAESQIAQNIVAAEQNREGLRYRNGICCSVKGQRRFC